MSEHCPLCGAHDYDGIPEHAGVKPSAVSARLVLGEPAAITQVSKHMGDWTSTEIIQGTRHAAAYMDCSSHPDAHEWGIACRLAAAALEAKDAELSRLRVAMWVASDLLAERTYWQFRSPGHNARIVLEAALSAP